MKFETDCRFQCAYVCVCAADAIRKCLWLIPELTTNSISLFLQSLSFLLSSLYIYKGGSYSLRIPNFQLAWMRLHLSLHSLWVNLRVLAPTRVFPLTFYATVPPLKFFRTTFFLNTAFVLFHIYTDGSYCTFWMWHCHLHHLFFHV